MVEKRRGRPLLKQKGDAHPVLYEGLAARSPSIDFDDSIWMLSEDRFATYPNLKRLDWGVALHDGSLLTDPSNRSLLLSMKQCMAALMVHHAKELQSELTIKVTHRRLIVFCRWLSKNGFNGIDIASSDIDEFLTEIADGMKDAHNPRKTLGTYCSVLRRLSKVGHLLSIPMDATVRIPAAKKFFGDRSPHTPKKKLFPDESKFIALVGVALKYAEPWVDDFLSLRESYIDAVNAMENPSPSNTDALWRALVGQAPLPLVEQLAAVGWSEIEGRRVASRLVTQIYNACYLLVAAFTGMRQGEVLTLRSNCVEWVPQSDGRSYAYLVGLRGKRKGSSRGEIGKWVASPAAVRAVELLERLRKPLHCDEITKKLFVAYSVKGLWPINAEKAKLTNLNERCICARLNQLAQDSQVAADWHFTSQQIRRSFARFVVMRDKRGLLALSAQYGHLHWAITDSAYVGTDLGLEALIAEQDLQDLSDNLTLLLQADSAAGAGFERLAEMAGKVAERPELLSQQDVDAMVESGVALVPCDWGFCVYRADLSACKGSESGPSAVRRSPDVCASCQNFAVDERSYGWWLDRRARNLDFSRKRGTPWQAILIAKQRVKVCDDVLAKIASAGARRS